MTHYRLIYHYQYGTNTVLPHNIDTQVLNHVETIANNFVSHPYREFVNDLILKAKTQVSLEGVEFYENLSEKEKVRNLFEAVRKQGTLPGNSDAPRKFLHILINFGESFGKGIREEIKNKFSGQINIIEQKQLLSPSPPQTPLPSPFQPIPSPTSRSQLLLSSSKPKKNNSVKLYIFFIMRGFVPAFAFVVVFLIIAELQPAHLQNTNEPHHQNSSDGFSSTAPQLPEVSTASPLTKQSVNNKTDYEIALSDQVEPVVTLAEPDADLGIDENTTSTTSTPSSKSITPELSITTTSTSKRPRWQVEINSYNDFNNYMSNVPSNREVMVGIFVNDPTEWQCQATLTNADRVERLLVGGSLYITCLLSILNQMSNLSHLRLNNRYGKLCGSNRGMRASLLSGEQDPVYLNKTTGLTIKGFTSTASSSCVDVYLAVAQILKTPNLIDLAIEKGTIDDHNMDLVRRVLKNNWSTLTHLTLKQTPMNASTPFFGRKMAGVLRNVTYFQVDYISNYVSSGFCNAMPNLKNLTSEKGYLRQEQLSQLRECHSLELLEISLKLTHSTTFDATIFASGFRNLKTVTLNLVHENCKSNDPSNINRLYLRGFNALRESLREIRILSRCRLFMDPASGSLSNPNRQETSFLEKRFYVFSYDLKDNLR